MFNRRTHFLAAFVLLFSQKAISLTANVTKTDTNNQPTQIATAAIIARNNSSTKRAIVFGTNAPFAQWPWQIAMNLWQDPYFLQFCGATLLNENWAITAAHCIKEVPIWHYLLQLGITDLNIQNHIPDGYQERYLQNIFVHWNYNKITSENDLSLLKFTVPIILLPNVRPILLPEHNDNFVGQTAWVTGWGSLYSGGSQSTILQQINIPILDNRVCKSMYRKAGYRKHIPHTLICAGLPSGGPDACQGDSGGPMVVKRQTDNRFVLVGITAWGVNCGKPNQPGVYTRISEYRSWITSFIRL